MTGSACTNWYALADLSLNSYNIIYIVSLFSQPALTSLGYKHMYHFSDIIRGIYFCPLFRFTGSCVL